MDYRAKGFHALNAEVEAQGGAPLPDKCLPREVEYTEPASTLLDNDGNKVTTYTCGCGTPTRFVSIYDIDPVYKHNNSGFIPACAVCDNMGAWPRYEQPVREADSEYWDLIKAKEEDD